MAALFAEENVANGIVATLRAFGHDVLTTRDAGRAGRGISDADQLHFATLNDRAIVTNNCWDFHRLHAADQNHAGIVSYTIDSDLVALATRIHQAIVLHGNLTSQLIRIVRPPPS